MESEGELEEEVPGVFLGAHFLVQCLECGNVIEGDIKNEHPEVEGFLDMDTGIDCPTCSQAKGHRALVSCVPLVGEAVSVLDGDEEGGEEAEEVAPEDAEPMFLADNVNLPSDNV